MDLPAKRTERRVRARAARAPLSASIPRALPAREGVLETRARRYARAATPPEAVERTVVTFQRGPSRYALSLSELCEIRPLRGYCRLPGAAAAVPGVVHYRGELLSLLDLMALSSARAEARAPAWVLVVEHERERLGLMADEVMDVLDLPVGAIQPLPLTLSEEANTFIGMTSDGVLIATAERLAQSQRAGRR